MLSRRFLTLSVAGLLLVTGSAASRAETNEVRLGDQYGLGLLPMYVLVREKLIEKHAAQRGLGDVKVTVSQFSGAAAVNDALLSGNIDFTIGGAGSLVLLWARTSGDQKVRGLTSLSSAPMYLLTTDPRINSLRDYGSGDKIGVPAAKVSMQAFALQMASQQLHGDPFKMDALTVSLPHTEGIAAIRTGKLEVKSYWTAIPFQNQALKDDPKVRKVASSFDVFGGPHTHITMYGTQRFKDANPRTFEAIADAYREAFDLIQKDPKRAAEIFVEYTRSKETPEFILSIMEAKEVRFSPEPQGMMRLAQFMYDVKTIKAKPESWKDLFFENVHGLNGN
jgi:NitT/TauT family transport system substrate-binding protein